MIMTFIERLEYLLDEQDMTQKELAELVGMRRTTISEWKKNGNFPPADIAVKIAQILHTTVEYLVTGKNKYVLPVDLQKMLNKYAEPTTPSLSQFQPGHSS